MAKKDFDAWGDPYIKGHGGEFSLKADQPLTDTELFEQIKTSVSKSLAEFSANRDQDIDHSNLSDAEKQRWKRDRDEFERQMQDIDNDEIEWEKPPTAQEWNSLYNSIDGIHPSVGITTDRFYTLDGGFASQLSKYVEGVDGDPLWSCRALHTNPEEVKRAYTDFVEAGADIITTNTYQANAEFFKRHIQFEVLDVMGPHDLIVKAARLADEAVLETRKVPRGSLIAGSIGSYGACQADGSEYHGNYVETMTRKELSDWHYDRMYRLLDFGQVDLLSIETIPSVKEALAILDTAMRFRTFKCWVSFQCKDGQHTAHGERFDDVIKQLLDHPAYPSRLKFVGVNCTDPSNVTSLLKLANKVNRKSRYPNRHEFRALRYVVYPNSGEIWDGERRSWSGSGTLDWIEKDVVEWMKLGANIIGGCCRVTAEGIKRLKEEMKKRAHEVNEFRAKQEKEEEEDYSVDGVIKRMTEYAKVIEEREKKQKDEVWPIPKPPDYQK